MQRINNKTMKKNKTKKNNNSNNNELKIQYISKLLNENEKKFCSIRWKIT